MWRKGVVWNFLSIIAHIYFLGIIQLFSPQQYINCASLSGKLFNFCGYFSFNWVNGLVLLPYLLLRVGSGIKRSPLYIALWITILAISSKCSTEIFSHISQSRTLSLGMNDQSSSIGNTIVQRVELKASLFWREKVKQHIKEVTFIHTVTSSKG